jgi:putative sugar O-methyltransferase
MIKFFGRRLSRFLAKRPSLLIRIQQAWLGIGRNVLDLGMASWVIRRPEWIAGRPIAVLKLLEPASLRSSGSNLAIANRMISAADHKVRGDENLVSEGSIWSVLRDSHYKDLIGLVEGGDADRLDKYLSGLFRDKSVNGYTYGSTFDTWPHRWHYLPIQIELSVVQLAEALGLIRAECHEQGEVAFWRKLNTEQELIEKLEGYFGIRVEQPRSGDPNGIFFGGRFLTRETCSHLHSAYKMRQAIDRKGLGNDLKIVEIGGGFGGTTFWLRKLLGSRISRHAIVDLPEVGLVQSFFLGSVEPHNLVLQGEARAGMASPLQLIPFDALSMIDFKPNVLINQDSMPEMPLKEVERYIGWASENVRGLFISFNQETYSSGGDDVQVYVPEVVSRYQQFRRISRETSWDRRGYVEEIYDANG